MSGRLGDAGDGSGAGTYGGGLDHSTQTRGYSGYGGSGSGGTGYSGIGSYVDHFENYLSQQRAAAEAEAARNLEETGFRSYAEYQARLEEGHRADARIDAERAAAAKADAEAKAKADAEAKAKQEQQAKEAEAKKQEDSVRQAEAMRQAQAEFQAKSNKQFGTQQSEPNPNSQAYEGAGFSSSDAANKAIQNTPSQYAPAGSWGHSASQSGNKNAQVDYIAQAQAEAQRQAEAEAQAEYERQESARQAEAQRQEAARQAEQRKADAEAARVAKEKADYEQQVSVSEKTRGLGIQTPTMGQQPADHPDSPAYTGAGWATSAIPASQKAAANIAQAKADAERNWGDLSDTKKKEYNILLGRPESYGTEESPDWKEAVHDTFAPSPGGFLYNLGVRGPGVTFDAQREQESRVDGLSQARYEQMDKVMQGIGNLAISAAPGGSAVMTVAKAVDAVQNKNMSVGDAIKNSLFEIGGGWAAGEINKSVLKEVAKVAGVDVAKGIAGYNQFAGLMNIGAEKDQRLPSFNPGGLLVGAAGQAAGVKGFTEPTGMTNPDTGTSIPNYVGDGFGRSSGGRSSGASTAYTAPAAPEAPTAPGVPDNVIGRISKWGFDGKAFGKSVRAGASKRYGGA